MADETLQTHDTYYMDGRMVILSCDGKLFRVPYWHLEKYSSALLRLAEPNTDGTRGTSDETAIPIDDLVSVEEFVMFLDFFYRGILRGKIPTEEWCKLLVISSKLDCIPVHTRAIDELTAKKTEVSPVDRIEFGNKFNIPQWLPEAYADAFVRESHLTVEEGKKLGLETTVKVLKGRDVCNRNGWDGVGPGVTQLVKEIFPPPDLRVSWGQRRRGRAGRFVNPRT